jgi:hypothetical protein
MSIVDVDLLMAASIVNRKHLDHPCVLPGLILGFFGAVLKI